MKISVLSFLCLPFPTKMSDDENRDQGAGLPQQPQLQLNQQLLDGVATIVNRQKEEIL